MIENSVAAWEELSITSANLRERLQPVLTASEPAGVDIAQARAETDLGLALAEIGERVELIRLDMIVTHQRLQL